MVASGLCRARIKVLRGFGLKISKSADCGKEAKQYKFVRNEAAFAGKEDAPLMKYEGTKPNFDGKQFVPVECDSGEFSAVN